MREFPGISVEKSGDQASGKNTALMMQKSRRNAGLLGFTSAA
jgi:hypothetical protein